MDNDKTPKWTYRVSKQELKNGEILFSIREFYLDDANEPTSWTEGSIEPVGYTLEELKWELTHMLKACDKPVIDVGRE